MSKTEFLAITLPTVHVLIQVALCVRVLLRPHREPASRMAWLLLIISMPVVGILVYILFGEVNIGRRRVQRMRAVLEHLPGIAAGEKKSRDPGIPERYQHLFRTGKSVNGFEPIGGNRAKLLPNSNATIGAIVDDIDAAREHVHVMFYIWLPDYNGCTVVEALKRAAERGVTCRAMADGMGSRTMIRSHYWKSMREAGVQVAVALPIGNPLLRILKGRIDLRNHRKIVVIDDRITYCGSQNCADPEFLIKAKYAPWVDAMMRFEGPVVRQNQYLFAADWMAHVPEDISDLLIKPLAESDQGFTAQVIGTGPTVRYSAMPEIFESLMYTARRELVITTPYYVPDEPMQAALCAAARRGVSTTLILPARNDSWVVAAASQSYYGELLKSGVQIYEYEGGLLHTKSVTVDGDVVLVGSANMDRRSFELNYENNILFYDPFLTSVMRHRQQSYIDSSRPVTLDTVASWPLRRRLWNNTIAILGPVL